MIDKITFTNFKSLRQVEASLGRFTVIVGPNGSGKTSILDGLDILASVTRQPLNTFLVGDRNPLSLMTRDATEPMTLRLSGRIDAVEVFVEVVVTRRSSASRPWDEVVTRRWGESETREPSRPLSKSPGAKPVPVPARPTPRGPNSPSPRGPNSPSMESLQRTLGSTTKLRLDIERLAAPSYSDEAVPSLKVNGEGLASVLADIAGRAPETFQAITEAARKVVPALERIRTRRAKVVRGETQQIVIDGDAVERSVERSYWGQQLLIDFTGARGVPAPLASEGTLLVIGLLTALHAEPRPRLLLLDDIDKALHPSAQHELVKQLRAILESDPNLQIVATSHSPYLLDHFEPEEVLVTALHPDGSTACAPLTAHPDFERWKATTRTGELWSFVGEEWVLKHASAQALNP